MAIISYYDVFPIGLGFDLAGGYLLASGLRSGPTEFAERERAARDNAQSDVRAAEDHADATIGISALAIGFSLQGCGYVLYIGGTVSHTRGAGAGLIAAGLLALALASGLLAGRATRKWLIRRFLIEVARWQPVGGRGKRPWAALLQDYAAVLGEEVHGGDYYGDRRLTGDAARFWGSLEVRAMATEELHRDIGTSNSPSDDG